MGFQLFDNLTRTSNWRKTGPNAFAKATCGAVLLGMWASIALAISDAKELSRYEASHRAMGSLFTIVLYAPDDDTARSGFVAAFRRIDALDDALNDYDPGSELSKLSASSPHEEPVTVSRDLWNVMAASDRYHRLSDGAFDVTVGPITTLWRQARRNEKLPSDDQLQAALDAVGFEHVHFSSDQDFGVSLRRANMRIDLGGIAKGFAVDEALAALRKHSITSALVNGGGDIAASNAPPGREGWKIGVAPLAKDAKPSIFLLIKNQAVATSGDTWQFIEIDGVRYSHIVDPKTGLGLTTRSSVTVVAPDCTAADALASSLSVMGPTKGLALIDSLKKTEALVIREVSGKAVVQKSQAFDDLPTQD